MESIKSRIFRESPGSNSIHWDCLVRSFVSKHVSNFYSVRPGGRNCPCSSLGGLRARRIRPVPLHASCGKRGGPSPAKTARAGHREERLDRFYLATDFSKGRLSQIHRGKRSPSLTTIVKLARALDVQVADFFGSVDPMLNTNAASQEGASVFSAHRALRFG